MQDERAPEVAPEVAKAAEDVASDVSTEPGDDVASPSSEGGFSRSETLIIFDWDDTLLPTTWLERLGILLCDEQPPSEEQCAQLQEMAGHAGASIADAQMHGEVVIVTNAAQGWVEKSCLKFMPTLYPIIADLTVVYARDLSDASLPVHWKPAAFDQEVSRYFGLGHEGRQNIVSIGDSMYEVQALKGICALAANRFGKSVKLMATPTVEEMIEQHDLLRDSLAGVVAHRGALDLCFDVDDADTEG